MEKIFNNVSLWAGIIGGGITALCGGGDKLYFALVWLTGFDYLTGIIKALYFKQLSSEIGYKGIFRKLLIFVVVAAMHTIEQATGFPARDIAVVFYIANETLSIVENTAEILPVPKQIKDFLLQLREKSDKGEKDA